MKIEILMAITEVMTEAMEELGLAVWTVSWEMRAGSTSSCSVNGISFDER